MVVQLLSRSGPWYMSVFGFLGLSAGLLIPPGFASGLELFAEFPDEPKGTLDPPGTGMTPTPCPNNYGPKRRRISHGPESGKRGRTPP